MACCGTTLMTCSPFTSATSSSVLESLAWAAMRVWLTYWRVVLSLLAMLLTLRPELRSAQMSFWLGVSGEDMGHVDGTISPL